jgi:predicted patatin/cPLA2 family phospholipase
VDGEQFQPVSAHAVRDVILARARAGSRPGQRSDSCIVGLCIEGGAMRGVVSAGMIAGLERLRLLDTFDRVYGSSAGAMNAAYLVAGQAEYGSTIYYENINNRRFINLARLVRGRPAVSLDFLVNDVMVRQKPLDTGRLLASPISVHVVATDVDSGRRATFARFASADDVRGALRASATMPIVAGAPYPYRHGRYFDAMLTEPIPTGVAEEEGCTHLVAFLTRPMSARGPGRSAFERLVVIPRLRRVAPRLAVVYEQRDARYHEALTQIDRGLGPAGRALVLPIRPGGIPVGKLERGSAVLREGARAGADAVIEALSAMR